jgi:hypothetical protein
MKQSRAMSLLESAANVAIGYGLAVCTQMIVFPWFDLPVRLQDNLAMGAIFTVVSLVRSFTLRRAFEAIRMTYAKVVEQSGAGASVAGRCRQSPQSRLFGGR